MHKIHFPSVNKGSIDGYLYKKTAGLLLPAEQNVIHHHGIPRRFFHTLYPERTVLR